MKKKTGIIIQMKANYTKDLSAYGNFDHYVLLHANSDKNQVITVSDTQTEWHIDAGIKQSSQTVIRLIRELPSDTNRYFFGYAESSTIFYVETYNKTFSQNINYKIFRDKRLMQTFLGASITGKKTSNFSLPDNTNHVEEFLNQNNKVILKPIDGNSSAETYIVNSMNQFNTIKETLLSTEYVLESFIEGKLMSIDFYIEEDKVYIFSIAHQIISSELENNKKIGMETFEIPIRYELDKEDLTNYEWDFLDKISKKLKSIEYYGFIHLEYKIDKYGSIGFIERGGRNGFGRNITYKEVTGKYISNIFTSKEKFIQTQRKNYFMLDKSNIYYVGLILKGKSSQKITAIPELQTHWIKNFQSKVVVNRHKAYVIASQKPTKTELINSYNILMDNLFV